MNLTTILSFMTSLIGIVHGTGDYIGLSGIERLINDEQYSSFRKCQAFGVKMHEAMMANKSMMGTPSRTITEKSVSFLLFTQTTPGNQKILISDNMNETLSGSDFNISRETVIYVHGLHETWHLGGLSFVNILLSRKDINLIITNWDSYAFSTFMYSRNVTTPILSQIIGKFVQKLIDFGTDSKKIHLIGHSAGGQAVALAAKMVTPKVGRITAYDPQGSCFSFLPPDQRISKEDADYVEIVHCTVGSHGMPLNITGDSTFYMNGGLLQPYCRHQPVPLMAGCSHMLCEVYLYLSLLNKSPLKGYKCDSYQDYLNNQCDFNDTVILTYDVPTNITGMYFVNTMA
ncbi:lipase member H-like isoform X2 [Planococcus citri]|uniref:lipase member H-like isoform X2 n=1 Tax=Planococcus citri TaxID=170843 RepID=UPI0031FA2DD0